MGKDKEIYDATNEKLPSDKEADKMNKESDKLAQELGFDSNVWEGAE